MLALWGKHASCVMFVLMELSHFSRLCQSSCRRHTTGDHLSYFVEVTGTHLTLVLGGRVTILFQRKLSFLQIGVGGHTMITITKSQFKHARVESVEAGQGYKLELVAHLTEFLLEIRNGLAIQLLFPVERRRTVIGQHLTREVRMNFFCETSRFR